MRHEVQAGSRSSWCPNPDQPTDLRITCVEPRAARSAASKPLPILAVDEPIYRRLPCFMIATVDKFAACRGPGEVGAFFGRVQPLRQARLLRPVRSRHRARRCRRGRLLPPDLIIQDELHLISGPLGTMVGLYETALDELCTPRGRWRDGPPEDRGLDRDGAPRREPDPGALQPRDWWTSSRRRARTGAIRSSPRRCTPSESNARLYVGVAAQGRSPKVVLLRVYLALLGAAAEVRTTRLAARRTSTNPADPYMTLVGYFNSLRELGGSAAIDRGRGPQPAGGLRQPQARRRGRRDCSRTAQIDYEPVELTSRESARPRWPRPSAGWRCRSADKEHVDVALATNMISVGLDITRLGLMVVFGQPKTSAEYIQATSRVGRDRRAPGPRGDDPQRPQAARPLALRALRGLPRDVLPERRGDQRDAVLPARTRSRSGRDDGGLARQSLPPMTPPRGAAQILAERATARLCGRYAGGAGLGHSTLPPAEADNCGAGYGSGRSICWMSGARRRWSLPTSAWACSTTLRRRAARSRCSAISSVPI